MDDMSTRVGLAVPQVTADGSPSAAELAAFARRAEEAGFDGLWVCELTSAPILDPLNLLAYAAAGTTRVRLGVAVLLTPLRVPYQLAGELATIDRLSEGRLDVGVGLGGGTGIYPRYGVPAERRLRRYLDGLELLRRLWTEERVTFRNEWWQLDDVPAVVRPVQWPHPPLWFGARRGRALRRAAELGDAWIGSGSTPPTEFLEALTTVRDHLDALGRERAAFTIGKRMYIHVTDDPGSARERARSWFAANYGNADLADRVALVGEPEHCVTELRGLRRAGVDMFLLNPMFEERDQLELLAADVVPQLG
ncbi:MAG: LLM class flavin-dependent oxidoreductase [Streptosporangiales bacterium]|nr:LLM class flavin-dependent oxidoreductase [Streptosporangiales bacterium]